MTPQSFRLIGRDHVVQYFISILSGAHSALLVRTTNYPVAAVRFTFIFLHAPNHTRHFFIAIAFNLFAYCYVKIIEKLNTRFISRHCISGFPFIFCGYESCVAQQSRPIFRVCIVLQSTPSRTPSLLFYIL